MANNMFLTVFSGRLTKDATIRDFGTTKITNFSVASSKRDAKTGNENTTFVNCSLIGTLGEKLQPHLKKGRAVIVHGSLDKLSTYKRQDDSVWPSMSVRVVDVELGSDGNRNGDGMQKTNYDKPANDQQFTPVENDDLPF